MNTYEQFKKLDINFACLGIQQLEHYENYYCTPKDAVIIGSAGVDGIPEYVVKTKTLLSVKESVYLSGIGSFVINIFGFFIP